MNIIHPVKEYTIARNISVKTSTGDYGNELRTVTVTMTFDGSIAYEDASSQTDSALQYEITTHLNAAPRHGTLTHIDIPQGSDEPPPLTAADDPTDTRSEELAAAEEVSNTVAAQHTSPSGHSCQYALCAEPVGITSFGKPYKFCQSHQPLMRCEVPGCKKTKVQSWDKNARKPIPGKFEKVCYDHKQR